jgi:hypothetical protein
MPAPILERLTAANGQAPADLDRRARRAPGGMDLPVPRARAAGLRAG